MSLAIASSPNTERCMSKDVTDNLPQGPSLGPKVLHRWDLSSLSLPEYLHLPRNDLLDRQ